MIDIGIKVNPYPYLAIIILVFVGTSEVIYYSINHQLPGFTGYWINIILPHIILEKCGFSWITSWIFNIAYWISLLYISNKLKGE